MLVNVKFFSLIFIRLLLTLLFALNFTILSANEKDKIITQLNNLDSLEFTFEQFINEKIEKGSCFLEFPGKLKCEYFDNKEKEIN